MGANDGVEIRRGKEFPLLLLRAFGGMAFLLCVWLLTASAKEQPFKVLAFYSTNVEPDHVHVAGIYVHRIFQGGRYEKRIERKTVRIVSK
jgi:hypothetical protein